MTDPVKIAMSWSGGKDCALALHTLLAGGAEVAALLTTAAGDELAVSHHGVPADLIRCQAESMGLPLRVIRLPAGECPPQVYADTMAAEMARLRESGVETVAFGDIFLEDLKLWREQKLAGAGMRAEFPIWQHDTRELARTFIDAGYRARLVSVQASLGEQFLGRAFDDSLLADLPPGVDPCGENGEFHTFVFDGPLFRRPVPHTVGEASGDGEHLHLALAPAAAVC